MSFIHQQFHSFLNLGACKEYPSMARPKSPTGSKTGKKNGITTNSEPTVPSTPAVAAETATAETAKPVTSKPETRRLEVVKADPRATVLPINLEEEIRRRAYELSERRGFSSGHETEDWLMAEREVRQRYQQHTA
jgi:hypothetical protein